MAYRLASWLELTSSSRPVSTHELGTLGLLLRPVQTNDTQTMTNTERLPSKTEGMWSYCASSQSAERGSHGLAQGGARAQWTQKSQDMQT